MITKRARSKDSKAPCDLTQIREQAATERANRRKRYRWMQMAVSNYRWPGISEESTEAALWECLPASHSLCIVLCWIGAITRRDAQTYYFVFDKFALGISDHFLVSISSIICLFYKFSQLHHLALVAAILVNRANDSLTQMCLAIPEMRFLKKNVISKNFFPPVFHNSR